MSGPISQFSLGETEVIGADPWLETGIDHPENVAAGSSVSLYTVEESGQEPAIDSVTNTVTEAANTGESISGPDTRSDRRQCAGLNE